MAYNNITYITKLTNAIAAEPDPAKKLTLTEQMGLSLASGHFSRILQAHIDKNPEQASKLLQGIINNYTTAITAEPYPTQKLALIEQMSSLLMAGNFNSTLRAHIANNPEQASELLQGAFNSYTNAIAAEPDPTKKLALTEQMSSLLGAGNFNSTLRAAIPTGQDMVILGDQFMFVTHKHIARADFYMANGAISQIGCTTVLAEEIGTEYQPNNDLLSEICENKKDLAELTKPECVTAYIATRAGVMAAFEQQQTDPNFVMPKTTQELIKLGAESLLKNNLA